jgi:hypothetical protein
MEHDGSSAAGRGKRIFKGGIFLTIAPQRLIGPVLAVPTGKHDEFGRHGLNALGIIRLPC